MNFARTSIAQFLAGQFGRVLRIAAGIGLIWLGITLDDTGWGVPLMLVGLVPLAAGLLDVCVLTALLGGPFSGPKVRALR